MTGGKVWRGFAVAHDGAHASSKRQDRVRQLKSGHVQSEASNKGAMIKAMRKGAFRGGAPSVLGSLEV